MGFLSLQLRISGHKTAFSLLSILIIFSNLITACSTDSVLRPSPVANTPPLTATTPPLPPSTNTPQPSPVPTATTEPRLIFLAESLPDQVQEQITLPPDMSYSESADRSTLRLGINQGQLLGYWTYALVAPFPSLLEGFGAEELISIWQHGSEDWSSLLPIMVSPDTYRVFSVYWGKPSSASVQVFNADDQKGTLLDQLWPDGNSLAIVPFPELTPYWKVLSVGGQKPTRNSYSPSNAVLSVPLTLEGSGELREEFFFLNHDLTNRRSDQLTTLALTGVTAMVRATAWTMEQEGVTYPARDIKPIFDAVDLVHISNEVPFAEDCPRPSPEQIGLYFCSDDRYIELLEYISTDIVELSGDHFGDWGSEAMLHTLELYQKRGWPTYGGGKNLQDGLQPAFLEHNGNRLAFIGCNAKGGKYAPATATEPGASYCNYSWMEDEISRLSADGYTVIVTLQHDEYYRFRANYVQERDFRRLAEAGAVIVSGSQAHQPQTMEFWQNTFIHYGLGNLFFDQYRVAQQVKKFQHTDQAFIDVHVIYQGQHISTELHTIEFIDYARSRPMSSLDRKELLQAVFSPQDWKYPSAPQNKDKVQ